MIFLLAMLLQATAAPAAHYPDSAYLIRRELGAAIEAPDPARIANAADRLARLGYAPTKATVDRIAATLSEPQASALRARFEANRVVRSAARQVASINPDHALVEGVAWDARHRRLFATTVIGRELLYSEGKQWRAVPGLDAGSLSGIAIDPTRRLLWVTSSATERTPNGTGAFRGLIAVDLDSLRIVRRLRIPGEGSPFDIAVGHDGTVYASDAMRGGIYRLTRNGDAVTMLVPMGTLRNPQGLVPAADGRQLYVADYLMGLMTVNLTNGSVTPMASDAGTMLDGIDGLIAFNGDLVAIQNGTSPMRIIRLKLGGGRITRAEVLESASPAWGEPTLGFVRGRELLYVDGQGPRYDGHGKPVGTDPIAPSIIRALPLGR